MTASPSRIEQPPGWTKENPTHVSTGRRVGHISIMYQGPEKSGKTTWASTWPRPYFFYFDTNKETIEATRGVPHVFVPDWKTFHRQMVPTIVNRLMHAVPNAGDPETLVFDTVSAAAWLCQREIMDSMGLLKLEEPNPNVRRQMYLLLFDKLHGALQMVCAATRPKSDHPGYNIVLLCHEREWEKEDPATKKMVTYAVRPAIEGNFKNQLPTMTDYVFGTRIRPAAKTKEGKRPPEAYVLTQSPTGKEEFYRYGGGNTGDEYPFPPEMPGDYATIAKALGLNDNATQKGNQ